MKIIESLTFWFNLQITLSRISQVIPNSARPFTNFFFPIFFFFLLIDDLPIKKFKNPPQAGHLSWMTLNAEIVEDVGDRSILSGRSPCGWIIVIDIIWWLVAHARWWSHHCYRFVVFEPSATFLGFYNGYESSTIFFIKESVP